MKRLALVVLLLAATLAAAQDKPAAALLQADRDFARAVATKGVDGWMEFMAENAVRLGSPPDVGKDAIRASMAKAFALPGFKLSWAPSHGELFKGGDLGYTVGTYQRTHTNGQGQTVTQHGSYLTIWQKQADGTWKVVWDGGSQDPAPAAKPSAKP